MKYKVISSNDGNINFEVEADSPDDAAYKALEALGWFISELDAKKDNDE